MVHGARSRRAPRFLSIHANSQTTARPPAGGHSIDPGQKSSRFYRRSSFSSNLLIASFFWPGLIQADIALSETLNPDE